MSQPLNIALIEKVVAEARASSVVEDEMILGHL